MLLSRRRALDSIDRTGIPGVWYSSDGRFSLQRPGRPFAKERGRWLIVVQPLAYSDEDVLRRRTDEKLLKSAGIHERQMSFPTLRAARQALEAVVYGEESA